MNVLYKKQILRNVVENENGTFECNGKLFLSWSSFDTVEKLNIGIKRLEAMFASREMIERCAHALRNITEESWIWMPHERKREYLDIQVHDIGTFRLDTGICANVMMADSLTYYTRRDMTLAWDKFSGSTIFPVDGEAEYGTNVSCAAFYSNPRRWEYASHMLKEMLILRAQLESDGE